MNKTTKISVILIIILIVVWIFYAVGKDSAQNDTTREDLVEMEENRPEISINTKHQYKDGMHVFVGTLEIPSPCHSYNAEIVEGNPFEVKLSITDPAEGEVCAQVITNRDFKVSYEASQDTQFFGTLNGEKIEFNLFEVGVDEDIDTVELYLKG